MNVGYKDTAVEEMLEMISDIHSSLDGLERAYGLALNTERCKLLAEQYKIVNQAQEALEAVEMSLKESPVYSIKLEKLPNQMNIMPNLGY